MFTQMPGEKTQIKGSFSGLSSGKQHGFHIHQWGNLSNSKNMCLSAKGHFNPKGVPHGTHVGDLGNLQADASGNSILNDKGVGGTNTINLSGPHSIVGRACVLHAGTDDLGKGTGEKMKGSKASGNAGPRIACGVVGLVATP